MLIWACYVISTLLWGHILPSANLNKRKFHRPAHYLQFASSNNSSWPRRNHLLKEQRKPRRPKSQRETRRDVPRERNPTLPTSTVFSSKFIQTLEFLPKPCLSWTRSWMTSSKESPLKLPDWPTTTNDQPSHPAKFKRLFVWSFQESWPSTPCQKEPRPSPSTLPASKSSDLRAEATPNPTALFRAT